MKKQEILMLYKTLMRKILSKWAGCAQGVPPRPPGKPKLKLSKEMEKKLAPGRHIYIVNSEIACYLDGKGKLQKISKAHWHWDPPPRHVKGELKVSTNMAGFLKFMTENFDNE